MNTNTAGPFDDNTIANRALGRDFGHTLVCLYIYRFNFSLKEILVMHFSVSSNVYLSMKKLASNISDAILRQVLQFAANISNSILSSSANAMDFSYFDRMHVLLITDHKNDSGLLSSEVDSVDIQQILASMERCKSITIKLQNTATTPRRAGIMFDGVIKSYPKMETRIGTNVSKIEIFHFETALMKLRSRTES